jgi:hypothetical protein
MSIASFAHQFDTFTKSCYVTLMHIVFDRHAERRMKEREVSEDEAESALNSPDYIEPSIKGRTNAFKYINGRHLRVTFKAESENILVITITVRKKSFKEE